MGVFTNTTSGWQYPNGVAVPPGESREIPGFNEPEVENIAKVDNTPNVLKLSIKNAKAEILLINDINELKDLESFEKNNQNRSGMLTLILERLLDIEDDSDIEGDSK